VSVEDCGYLSWVSSIGSDWGRYTGSIQISGMSARVFLEQEDFGVYFTIPGRTTLDSDVGVARVADNVEGGESIGSKRRGKIGDAREIRHGGYVKDRRPKEEDDRRPRKRMIRDVKEEDAVV